MYGGSIDRPATWTVYYRSTAGMGMDRQVFERAIGHVDGPFLVVTEIGKDKCPTGAVMIPAEVIRKVTAADRLPQYWEREATA